MGQIFRRKKFSSYLGEQRAIDDIVMMFTEDIYPSPTPTPPNPSPTSTPAVTPTTTPTVTQTPTNTSTPTTTPTNTQTPTNTGTPTPTPSITPSPSQPAFYAYIFPEAQDSTSLIQLGDYMTSNGSTLFFGYGNSGVPAVTVKYSNDLDVYAHFPGFVNGGGPEFMTPVSSFRSGILQGTTGFDSFGCPQTQYTFGTIEIDTNQIDISIQYFYSIWIPLAGVGGSMTNMTCDAGYGGPCSFNIFGGAMPEAAQAGAGGNVTVTSGAAIPAGTYRVLWINPNLLQPASPPANQALYIKGNHKY
jgi:hypothetical protein